MYFCALKVKCRYVKKTSQFNMKLIYHGKKHGKEIYIPLNTLKLK